MSANDLEERLKRLQNLIAAQQMVIGEIAGKGYGEPLGRQTMQALVGLGDAVEAAAEQVFLSFQQGAPRAA